MRKQLFGTLALAALAAGCADTANTNTTNTNTANVNVANTANLNSAVTTASPMNTNMTAGGSAGVSAPDNSMIETTEINGETRQVRRFSDPNSPVERVEVTTRAGRRTAKVYYRDQTVRDLPDNRVERALEDTGEALGTAGGYVADKTRQGVNATREAAGEVGRDAERALDKAADRTKEVGSRAVEAGREGGNRVVEGAKEVGKDAAKGAKKAGNAIKDAVN